MIEGKRPGKEEFFPTVAVETLMSLLRDPSINSHHSNIAQAIVFIFRSLGLKCVPYLKYVFPDLFYIMEISSPSLLEFFFRQLSVLIAIVKQHIRPYLNGLLDTIVFFFPNASLQSTILDVVDNLSIALDGEFKMHVPILMPMFLIILQSEKVESAEPLLKLMNSFVLYGSNIEEYLHLIIPSIVGLFDSNVYSVRIASIECIGDLCRTVNLNEMASRIIHPLLRVIGSGNEELRKAALDTLCSLCYQMGSEFTVFIDVVNKALTRYKIHNSTYEQLVNKLINSEPLPQNLNPYRKKTRIREEVTSGDTPSGKLPVNQQHLKQIWDVSQKSTREDWAEWFRKLSVELLKESPSHAIRACASIAVVHGQLARDLFNSSFYSCYFELYDQYKEDLSRAIEAGIKSPTIPPDVLQILLNLCEFMEHDEKQMPIESKTLAAYSSRCHAYAKALHYKELEFIQEPNTATIEELIGINNQLQQSDAAVGILKHAQRHHNLLLKETWYEKLQRWDEALESYNSKVGEEADSLDNVMGQMRCLHALGEWDQLSNLAQEKWMTANSITKQKIAPLAAAASWGLGQWEKMDTYIGCMKQDTPDRSFFNSILCIHRNNFEEASSEIVKAREQLIQELTALVSESYNRAYGVVVPCTDVVGA